MMDHLAAGRRFHTAILSASTKSAVRRVGRQLGSQLIEAKFSRDKEFEADHFGVIYARKAGFDPTQSIAFFDRLQKQEKTQPGLAKAFENHPDTSKRVGALCTELTGMGYEITCPVTPGPAPAPEGTQPSTPAGPQSGPHQ
jgi:predicted Zn-dependent protease